MAFKRSREIKRKFDTKEYKVNIDEYDVVTRNIKNNIDIDLVKEISKSKSGAYQDLIMAYLYIQSDNDHIQRYGSFDALSDVDMIEKSALSRAVSDSIKPVELDEVTPKLSIFVNNLSETISTEDFDMEF